MRKTKKHGTQTSTKVLCARCGKEHFVNFVADGHRDYFCEECIKIMHHDRKKGKLKKVISPKTHREAFEFICDICDNFRRASYSPTVIDGLLYCRECESKKKAEDVKKKRKRVIIAIKDEEN